MTIEAVIYGLIDMAKTENLENAPPEIISINPANPLAFPIASFKAILFTPGTVMKHPNRNTTINTNVYNNLFLTSGVEIAFLIVLNN